jgi:hypothetical protein
MAFTHIDLIGLNKYEMHDAPIVGNDTELKVIAQKSKGANRSISIAGMRHSQGGHTALEGGRMVFTEAMQGKIKLNPKIAGSDIRTITVDAGVTWDNIHHFLAPLGLAPLVHQSSAGFTVGGSLSVDCHGREVHEGAISNTVESLTVLTNKEGKLEETSASRTENSKLFWATLGGYGACGVILNATIRVTENTMMRKYGTHTKSLAELKEYLTTASEGIRNTTGTEEKIAMFYAWLNVSKDPNKYLCESMVYEYMNDPGQHGKALRTDRIKEEKWAASEAMKLAWEAGRVNPKIREQLFELIRKNSEMGPSGYIHRINYLREETSFLGTKGGKTDVDLLQEYFIPLSKITEFLIELKQQIPHDDPVIDVLSCTLRVIKPPSDENSKPYLSYQSSTETMVSVALEVKVNKFNLPTDRNITNFKITEKVTSEIQIIIDLAISKGGSYYLPYYKIATLEQLKKAYSNCTQWKHQADIWNPINDANGNRLFSNEFLKEYLNELTDANLD